MRATFFGGDIGSRCVDCGNSTTFGGDGVLIDRRCASAPTWPAAAQVLLLNRREACFVLRFFILRNRSAFLTQPIELMDPRIVAEF
jgi:hypothetical protein